MYSRPAFATFKTLSRNTSVATRVFVATRRPTNAGTPNLDLNLFDHADPVAVVAAEGQTPSPTYDSPDPAEDPSV